MIEVDGSQGEGGGQVLRTSLSLSALTGQPFRITGIRANRSRPGLRPQHLTAIRAVAGICAAEVQGDKIDLMELVFKPGKRPQAGNYLFDVTQASPSGRSAGSVTLVMQAILWPLLFAAGKSEVTIRGGTFVPYSPPYHYLAEVALPAFARFGALITTSLTTWGWMESGSGEMTARIEPVTRLQGVHFESQTPGKVGGIAAVTNLPSHIPHRMARRAHNVLAESGLIPEIEPYRGRGAGPGAGIALWVAQGGADALGRKGLPADKVAEAAVADLLAFVENGAAVDHHLADQILVPMALARGESSFTTGHLTRHTMTNVELLQQWLGVSIFVKGSLNGPGEIRIKGIDFHHG